MSLCSRIFESLNVAEVFYSILSKRDVGSSLSGWEMCEGV